MLCPPRCSTLQACWVQVDHCAPTYFVMGDGGNEEGPSTKHDKKDAVRSPYFWRNSLLPAACCDTLCCAVLVQNLPVKHRGPASAQQYCQKTTDR